MRRFRPDPTVVGRSVELVRGEALPEGTVVTILSAEDREAFALPADAEATLLLRIEEAERGEVISGAELLREIRRG